MGVHVYKEEGMAMVYHICLECIRQDTCHLWDQIMNIDEAFVKDVFYYDPRVNSVCTTVSYCKNFKQKPWE